MEHLALWIYLFEVVDNLRGISIGVLVLSGSTVVIAFIILPIILEEGLIENSVKILKYLALASCVSLAIIVFMPDSKTIAAMLIIPRIAQNKDIQKLPANVAKTLNDAVVSWGKELSKDGK
jgi:hypothetical protein